MIYKTCYWDSATKQQLERDCTPVEIAEIEQRKIPKPLVERQAARWEAIKVERDRRKEAGYQVGTKWFHGDTSSRIQQLGLMIMGAGVPANLQWKTMDGTFVAMTPTLAGQVFGAAAANDQAIFAKAEQHRVGMEASADPSSYDFSGGWPLTFAGV